MELCRKKSLTPDARLSFGSLSRTPMTLNSRSGRSSLAASPILEKVRIMSGAAIPGGSPLQLNQQARRSLPKQAAANARSTGAAVLDRAAEAIVYDLVRVDSPDLDSAAIIDPNSSLGTHDLKKKSYAFYNTFIHSFPQKKMLSRPIN